MRGDEREREERRGELKRGEEGEGKIVASECLEKEEMSVKVLQKAR
jgi:hypothetical protein